MASEALAAAPPPGQYLQTAVQASNGVQLHPRKSCWQGATKQSRTSSLLAATATEIWRAYLRRRRYFFLSSWLRSMRQSGRTSSLHNCFGGRGDQLRGCPATTPMRPRCGAASVAWPTWAAPSMRRRAAPRRGGGSGSGRSGGTPSRRPRPTTIWLAAFSRCADPLRPWHISSLPRSCSESLLERSILAHKQHSEIWSKLGPHTSTSGARSLTCSATMSRR
mmetsp:Transcript_59290/g.150126  ORF Transcript_59290/g.150126 Transcript_59290/m.150126 type:complete len:221 (+) Transcript_59290:317-979(+)